MRDRPRPCAVVACAASGVPLAFAVCHIGWTVKAIAAETTDATRREDATLLLLDQARVLDGDKPADPRAFADRLSRLLELSLKPA